MKTTYNDLYFVSAVFAYGAELDEVIQYDDKKEFAFSNTVLSKAYLLEEGTPTIVHDLTMDEAYGHYQKRKLLYPPNFPDGRRRFLELLHAKEF